MNPSDTLEFVDSGRYRVSSLPANPPSVWTEVAPALQEAAVLNVLKMSAQRDSHLVDEVESAAKALQR